MRGMKTEKWPKRRRAERTQKSGSLRMWVEEETSRYGKWNGHSDRNKKYLLVLMVTSRGVPRLRGTSLSDDITPCRKRNVTPQDLGWIHESRALTTQAMSVICYVYNDSALGRPWTTAKIKMGTSPEYQSSKPVLYYNYNHIFLS